MISDNLLSDTFENNLTYYVLISQTYKFVTKIGILNCISHTSSQYFLQDKEY